MSRLDTSSHSRSDRTTPIAWYYKAVASFYVQNFGCRATQADGAAIERQFEEHGFERAASLTQAEVVVLNTCTVTASADQDARAAIRRLHRMNPGARIVVTGCYAQRAPEELAAMPGVAQVIGNSHKHRLIEIALPFRTAGKREAQHLVTHTNTAGFVPLGSLSGQVPSGPSVFVSDIFAHTELLAAPVFDAANERTRPNLKVQDGCDNRCSFCVIPFVRGQSRSLAVGRIMSEVNRLVAAGFRELVISGINLGRWGRDLENRDLENMDPLSARHPRPRFEDLVRTILECTTLEKLRISSVEPMDWSDELIQLVAGSRRIARHAHVPMQSGSDAVLRRMHRKYRPWHYREKIEKIRAAMPDAAIGADVMVGFPGETDTEFEETRLMIEALSFTYLHVFTYSARPGTAAAQMTQQVPPQVARERNRILRHLAAEKKRAFLDSHIGKIVQAITLHASSTETPEAAALNAKPTTGAPGSPWRQSSSTEALTDNYLRLVVPETVEANQWITARVNGVTGNILTAEIAG
jgi:threonylcarbamoyladenosine tRNA methylthiotransferase MtaB